MLFNLLIYSVAVKSQSLSVSMSSDRFSYPFWLSLGNKEEKRNFLLLDSYIKGVFQILKQP